MVNYLAWAKADPLTGEQAARLWAEVDPSTPSYTLTPEQAATIAACLQMISGKITIGALKADTHANGFAFIGRHENSLISREALRALALSLDERPAFLFDQSVAPTETKPEKVDQIAAAPSSLSDRLFSGSGWAADPSKPSPIRVVPGARRVTQAPPPPPYLRGRGGFGPVPPRPAEPLPQPVVATGRLGAAVPIDSDDAVMADMTKESEKLGAAFSVRAYVLEHEKDIGGDGNLDSKIRRLQRKFEKQEK